MFVLMSHRRNEGHHIVRASVSFALRQALHSYINFTV